MAEYEVSKEQLLEAIRYDCEVFLGFYLGEELELGVPAFHKELWDEFLDVLEQVNDPEHMTGILKKLTAVPREHAKTTITKLAVLLFLRYSKLSFCAYTSNTIGTALNSIRDIRSWFMSDADASLYGPSASVKANESDALYILDIQTPIQRKPKRIILKAFGQGSQIRGTLIEGKRPDFLVFDDIESRETAESTTLQAKLDSWCLGTALKSMGRRGLCVFIGNMISDTTLLARLAKDESWNPTVLGAIVQEHDGELRPLWEGRWTVDALLEDYASFRRLGQGHIWEAELMNLTNKEVFGESLEDAIMVEDPLADELEAGFICLDPAFGQNAWNDESAITVHGRFHGGDIPAVVDSSHNRWSTDRVFEEMLTMSMKWGIRTWVIEAVAAQRLLLPYFRALMNQRKINPELFLMLPITAGKETKSSRILTFRGAIAAGSYALAESQQEIKEKLQAYSPASKEHDDLCDSGAYGPQVWALFGELVKSKGTADVAGLMFGSMSGARSVSAVEMGVP